MTSDVAGYARTLATQRKRNVELVEQAVTESRTFTEQEAATAPAAPHRPHRDRPVGPPEAARRPHDPALRRDEPDAADAERRAADGRDDVGAEGAERDRAPADCLPAAHARHARPDRRDVESRLDSAGRRRRHLPVAGVLRLPGAAGQLRRRPPDSLRARPAHPGGQGHELRPARRRRNTQPVLRVDAA